MKEVFMSTQLTGSNLQRRPRLWGVLLAAAVSGAAASVTVAKDVPPAYHLVKEIPVAGDTGWDYLSVDAEARRLYVTHGTHIVVIDLDTNSIVGDIADTPGVHGFAIAPELGKGFSSNGGEAKVSVVDLKSLATVTKVATDEGPDAVIYEPTHKEVYSFNGRAKSATIFSAVSGQVVASLKMPGKPEFPALDTAGGRVFVNIEDKNEVAVIDTGTHKIVNEWPIAPGEGPSGMAFDASHQRLFLGCDNHLMLMLDSNTGKAVGSVPIGAGVDANAFDEQLQLAFSSNGDGTLTIAREERPDKLVVVQTLRTQTSGRTMALDPKTHRIYVAAAIFLPTEKNASVSSHHRATVPGTFKVLVYGP
jgi:DNA-binding beta-propeller fold protein YncE